MSKKWVICKRCSLGGLALLLTLALTPLKSLAAPAEVPQAKSVLQYQSVTGSLLRTLHNRPVQAQLMPFFASPELYAQRWQAIQLYFGRRFGIDDPQHFEFRPQIIVLHSAESESAGGVYQTFAHGSESQYLGGVWSHFLVDHKGQIIQYSPLNRISKGQAGVNDLAVGIEILGSASRYRGPQRLQAGSIARRLEAGQSQQMAAVLDLVQSLQRLYGIPSTRIYSHQEVASIGRLSGSDPDFDWLKGQIRDRVYLGEIPDLKPNGRPQRKYARLQPYGRSDPGPDLMHWVRQALHTQTSLSL